MECLRPVGWLLCWLGEAQQGPSLCACHRDSLSLTITLFLFLSLCASLSLSLSLLLWSCHYVTLWLSVSVSLCSCQSVALCLCPWCNHGVRGLVMNIHAANLTHSCRSPPLMPEHCAGFLVSMYGLAAVSSALFHQARTGEGQLAEVRTLLPLPILSALYFRRCTRCSPVFLLCTLPSLLLFAMYSDCTPKEFEAVLI